MRHELRPDRLRDAPAIFGVEEDSLVLFCIDLLKDTVEAADLTGFSFEPVWSSDAGGIHRPLVGIEPTVGEPGRQLALRDRKAHRATRARLIGEGVLPGPPAPKRAGTQ